MITILAMAAATAQLIRFGIILVVIVGAALGVVVTILVRQEEMEKKRNQSYAGQMVTIATLLQDYHKEITPILESCRDREVEKQSEAPEYLLLDAPQPPHPIEEFPDSQLRLYNPDETPSVQSDD